MSRAAGTGLARVIGCSRREDPAAYSRAWREKNREKSNAYMRDYYHRVTKKNAEKLASKNLSGSFSRRKAKYGITRDEYETMALNQKGRCAICNEEPTESLRVDHDHETGKVRALLCNNCNAGLGHFRDDPELLASAITYLTKYSEEGRE